MKKVLSVLVFLFILAGIAFAETESQSGQSKKQLRVAVHTFEPCVMRDQKTGEWTGYEIELLEAIAKKMKLECTYVEAEKFTDLFSMIRSDQADIAVAGITINEEREKNGIDFSHRSLDSGLGILVRDESPITVLVFIQMFFSKELWMAIGFFFLLLIVFGYLIWFCEKAGGGFHEGFRKGFHDASWYAFAVVSTCGFGDFSARKPLGRLITIFAWLIGGLLLPSFVYGYMTSAFTMERFKSDIRTQHDLRYKTVVTQEGTTSVEVLKQLGANVVTVATIAEGYDMLQTKKADAVVFDVPALRYYRQASNQEVMVLPITFEPQDYGFMLKEGSNLREPINRALLAIQANGVYKRLQDKYFKQ